MNILYWLSPRDLEELDSALAKIKYLVASELRTMLLNILVAFTGFGHLAKFKISNSDKFS